MANVGCDVSRVIQWRKAGNVDFAQKAFERVLELLDLTIRDPKNSGPRRRELTRVREVLVDYFAYDNVYGSTDELWEQYFFAYNYAAALERGK